jgi:hypothetical protein
LASRAARVQLDENSQETIELKLITKDAIDAEAAEIR